MITLTLLISESAYEDEEQFARGGTTPGEDIISEEDDDQGGGGTNNFPLRMASDVTRGRITARGFLRGTAAQQVNFDPEAPPLPPMHVQTTCLLERPEIDKKVKVMNEYKIDACRFESVDETESKHELIFHLYICQVTQHFRA